MLNQDRFKTADECVKAFGGFCIKHQGKPSCDSCIGERDMLFCKTDCFAHWLALEAEEEKPEPCPFCGSRMGERQSNDLRRVLICDNRCCGYITSKSNTIADAIAAHNRVARAVRAAREGEVK